MGWRRVRRAIALFLFLSPLSGCLQSGREDAGSLPPNPALLAPKLLVARTPENRTILFLRSALSDLLYDTLSLEINHSTLLSKRYSYGIEHSLDSSRFFVVATAQIGEERFSWNGTLALGERRIEVQRPDETAPRQYPLPFEVPLDREESR